MATTQPGAFSHARAQASASLLISSAVVCAALAGVAAVLAGPLVAAALAGVVLFAACAYRPIFATYTYLLTIPFIAGIDRGTLIPLVRPNEGLLALLVTGALLGGYLRYVRGATAAAPLRLRKLDAPLATFALLATLWPVTSMMLQGHQPTGEDLAAILPTCKLMGLLLLVRITVVTREQLVRCVRLIVWPASAIAVIAILQTLNFGPVVSVLESLWSAGAESSEPAARGTATLGSSFATGDYIVFGLTLVICCAVRGILGRRESMALGFLLGAGILAAGQYSTWIATLVAAVVLLVRLPVLRRKAGRCLPIAGAAALLGAPAFMGRLGDFENGKQVPGSWAGRWDNLTHFYLPRLGNFHFVLGVSPNSVLPAPETWRDVIYLESGYLQFLWVGGIPLLAAFVWLSVAVLRTTSRLQTHSGLEGAFAATLEVAWWIVVVVSVLDSHLFLRGAGDLLFTMLAITSGRAAYDRAT